MPRIQQKIVKSKGLDAASATEKAYFALYDENVQKYGPNTAVLYLVGRFYEIYDYVEKATGKPRTNVERLAELCGCTVEHKPCTDPAYSRLFWGFPQDSLPKFQRMLVSAGMSVAVYGQEKDATGDVVARPFDHIASPGIYLEDDLPIRKEEQCMLSVFVEPWYDEHKHTTWWSLASTAFDVSTGLCESTESEIQIIDGKPVLDVIQPFWSLHPPAEIIWIWCGLSTTIPSEDDICGYVSPTHRPALVHKRQVQVKDESGVAADRLRLSFLSELYTSGALSIQEYLGISHYPVIRKSLTHLLQFIKEHNRSYLTALSSHTVWCASDQVLLGNAALQQLGALPISTDKPQESLLYWLQKAITAMGRRLLRERLLKPIAQIQELNERQERIAAYRSQLPTEISSMLRGMCDLERVCRRIQMRTAETKDLLALTTTYEKAHNLLEFLTGKSYSIATPAVYEHVHAHLNQFTSERIATAIHPWRRGIHGDLDALEDKWTILHAKMNEIRQEWNAVLNETDGVKWMLREDAPFTFIATQRRTMSLVQAMRRKYTISHKKNGNAKTEFILETDEIVQGNAEAVTLRSQITELVAERLQQFYTEFSTPAKNKAAQELIKVIGTTDAEFTIAEQANRFGYVRPEYLESETCGVEVLELRHPIIERISSVPYIPHSLRFGQIPSKVQVDAETTAGILLYGVNAAGKSSLGKALGLAVLMAQTGIPVPATAMRIAPYNAIFTRILGNDNLWAGMSSFVVEMTEFRSILRAPEPAKTLVIGDELCAGTETASATSIVAAGVELMAQRGMHFLFATHLHELAEIVRQPNIAAYHLTVHSDPTSQTLIYDRKLKPGCGSPMYGLEVCRGLDMDKEFLERAFNYRRRFFEAADPHASRYNAAVIVNACAICGSREGLESHHIIPQAESRGKMSPTRVHHESNLVPLCDACHTKHHQGLYEIQGWIMTSEGRKLQFTAL